MNLEQIPTPCYVCREEDLLENLAVLERVQASTGCQILLALKAFAMFDLFPLLRQILSGTSAASLHEARLGSEEFGGSVHTFAPAYRDDEFDDILRYSDHVIFNSFSQWDRYRERIKRTNKTVSCGLRINPEVSVVSRPIYDPCRRFSRLGIPLSQFDTGQLNGLDGIHFHALCECGTDELATVLEAVEQQLGEVLKELKWINFGGGHHITRADYDVEALCNLINTFQKKYDIAVILEPGEAVVLNAGVLVASVLDIISNEIDIAVLDTSATTHMPDVIEMPYRPDVVGAGMPDIFPHNYQLAGLTCLAGDIIGEYSFPTPLKPGDKLVFTDMLHYTMVKNTAFNGVRIPSIAVWSDASGLRLIREFTYDDYRTRLS